MLTRSLRRQFLLSSTMLVTLTGYINRAYGQQACTYQGGYTYLCNGVTIDQQTIFADNAIVVTGDNFEVDTTAPGSPNGNAFNMGGYGFGLLGAVSFTDVDGSTLTAGPGYTALNILVSGNYYAITPGSITVYTNGVLLGGHTGLFAYNDGGSGSVDITVNGSVTGTDYYGIHARNSNPGGSLAITTGAGSSVTGGYSGIMAQHYGQGALSITANGDVTGLLDFGILARSYNNSTGLNITTGAGGTVTGNSTGIYARHTGSGALTIDAQGDVEATDAYGTGIYAVNFNGVDAGGTGIDITTGGTVTGPGIGIYALNHAAGALNIVSTGEVFSGNAFGIFAYNTSSGSTGLSIESARVTAQITGIEAINNGTGELSILATGDITGTNGAGITALHYGGDIDIVTLAGTTVSGNSRGISVTNRGTGTLTIAADGNVQATANGSRGIYARNLSAGSTGLDIATQAVSGGASGIYARNDGAGALTIVADGDVQAFGTGGTGIEARNNSALSTTLSIAAQAVGGTINGIFARNSGTGDLTITANGDVTGNVSHGIYARNNNGTDLGIASQGVSGGHTGIEARNDGSGALTITADGAVAGGSSRGIRAHNEGTSLTIAAAMAVTGGNDGIEARNFGSGALTITANGNVTGTSRYGIHAENYGNGLSVATGVGANISGGVSGLVAYNNGSGASSVTVNGDVTGITGNGISALNTSPGTTSLTVTTAAGTTVSSVATGISALSNGSGAVTVIAQSDVHTTDSYSTGIEVFNNNGVDTDGNSVNIAAAGTVTAGWTGIYAYNYGPGAVNIVSTGEVSGGTGNGIAAYNVLGTDLNITSAQAAGYRAGIDATNAGTGNLTILATGDVSASAAYGISTGIRATAYGGTGLDITTLAGVAVTGAQRGINAVNNGSGTTCIVAGGDVTGSSLFGIFANTSASTTDLGLTTMGVSGGFSGIYALNGGSGALTVATNGDVTGGTGFGILAQNSANGTDLDFATGIGAAVSGGTTGIEARNNGTGALTLIANGNVTGTANNGILARNEGTDLVVTTGAGVAVGGAFNGIEARNNGTGALTVTAEGDVTGTGNAGLYGRNQGTDLIAATGDGVALSGGDFGLVAINSGTGELAVTANGDVTGSNIYGIFAQNAGTDLTIAAGMGGAITGGYDGIVARGFGSGALTITVDGSVSGIAGQGILAQNFGTDLAISTAAGTGITGNTHGIRAQNSGSGPVEIGIAAGSAVTSTGSGYAIDISGSESSVTVAGTLTGGAGGAIRFDDFENRLVLYTGAAISGDVVGGADNDSLSLEGEGSGMFDLGLLQNFESIVKDGIGHWILTGANNDMMTLTHNEGQLTVNGSLAFTDLIVNAGASLGGNGMFGALTVAAGSAIAPGNSIGTINVVDITFDPGSIFEVEVNAAGQSDRIEASGTATLNGGTVQVVPFPDFAVNTPYTILTAVGGVIGTFDDVAFMFGSMFLTPELLYATDAVSLILNQTAFADVAATRNQRAAATGVDPLGMGNAVYEAIVALGSAGEAQAAFDSLSGEIHASLGGILADQSRHMRGAVLGRLTQASGGGASEGQAFAALAANEPLIVPSAHSNAPVFWMRGFGARAEFDTDGNAASTDRKLGGFVMGVDRQIAEGWRAGLAAGFTESDIHTSARASSANVDSYHLAAYAGGTFGGVRFSGGASFARHEIDTNRSVAFPGFAEQINASWNAHTGQVFGEAAYPLAAGSLDLEPFAGLAYVHVDTDAFRESGGAAALEGSSSKEDVGYLTLGQRVSATTQLGNAQLTAHASAAWQHAFGDTKPDANLSFAGGGAFNVAGVPQSRDSALLAAGLDLGLGSSATLGISYTGRLSGSAKDHGIELGLSWQF